MNASTVNKEISATRTAVLIIGSGFSGLGMAVNLKREGKHDFLVLERAADVGGTWRDNTYPGAACDIQSHLYSYSFKPNPRWSRVYAPQPEILEYLRSTAREEQILAHIRFGAAVERACWHEDRKIWVVQTPVGVFEAPVLISAAGHLSDPSYPDIPGISTFQGQIFHSAQWDHEADWSGKRVGVIGTGASAIQIVPQLARTAGRLTVFQRSAPYIIPRRDHVYSEAEQGMFERFPEAMQELRDELFWGNESRFPQRRQVPAFIEMIRGMAVNHLQSQIPQQELRKKLTPHYAIGCKRILISNDYYPSLMQSNVDLETAGIERIDETGVILKNGEKVELDLLVVATGFEATELPIAELIHGVDGQSLAQKWKNGGYAFACTTVSGFPNFFFMLGPNTGLGAGSMIFMIETQINYIREGANYVLERGVVAEPDAQAEIDYTDSIQRRSQGTVWVSGGCSSWYLHPTSGKLTALWPDFMSQFRKENGSFSAEGYHIRAGVAAEQA